MQNQHLAPAGIAPIIASLLAAFSVIAACGEPDESAPMLGGTNAQAFCASDADCAGSETSEGASETSEEGATRAAPSAWLTRCTKDSECGVGQCVCGLCSEPCNAESTACSELPEGAACFSGRDIARAAVCHASTVPGICLPACSAGDDCGEGYICALGACLPSPPAER